MNARDVTRSVKEEGLSVGFCKVGVARVESLTGEGLRLREWLARGYHGTMDWMARNAERRTDPRTILPGAKSVVVAAMNYYTDVRHVDRPQRGLRPQRGKVSRYAWGDDYHEIVGERLERLKRHVQSLLPDVQVKLYVDTGPVLEKAWAVRAGIGWLGKHTNVITRDCGSWVFLGELIIDQELEYDSPIADYCGSCTSCIDACPTGAIVEPYVLDSNRCISYLTVEYRGETIPEDLASKSERWVYGCDICQDVCPWNVKFSQPTAEHRFQPRSGNVAPLLEELASMSREAYEKQYRKSPMKRAKYEGLVRNARACQPRHEVVPLGKGTSSRKPVEA